MTEDEFIGVVAICGNEGTGKSSMALTFPRPIHHLDIDVGGFRRAIWRLEDKTNITSTSFPKPIQMGKLMGQDKQSSTRISVPKKVEGMKELWQAIITEFVTKCTNPDISTLIVDSATMLWNICHQAYLQELQERQLANHLKRSPNVPFDENDYRERLQPIEYGPANDRMTTVLHTARSYGKNLVLTHYPTDEYGPMPDGKGGMVEAKTGKKVIDGFKHTTKLADLVVWTDLKESNNQGVREYYPSCKVTKCGIEGMGLNAVGMEFVANFESLINLRNLLRG